MLNQELLQGQTVKHKAYGSGNIRYADGNHMEVHFDVAGKDCRFVYPDAFESYLTLEDEELAAQVQEDLAQKRHRVSQEQQERAEKYGRMDKELHELHRKAYLKRKQAAEKKSVNKTEKKVEKKAANK